MLNNELWQKPTAAGAADFYSYQIPNSVRLNGIDQAFEKTWGSAATNDDAKALSVWIKRSNSAFGSTTNEKIVSASTGNGSVADMWEFNTNNPTGYSDAFGYVVGPQGGTSSIWGVRRFRDPSAWLHIIYIYNSNEVTAADRIKVYFNGVRTPTTADTSYWDINGSADPSSGTATAFGKNANEMHIARYVYNDAGWWGGQMADWIMIDGTAAYTDFGEFKNGVWIPKDPSGLTFGTNGFHLDFADSSDFGNDVSGNNNDFTVIGTIATHDQMLDSPTFGSEGSANFATLGPLWKTSDMTLSEGNLKWSTSTNQRGVMSNWSVPLEGKFYWEYIPTGWGSSSGDDMWCGVNQATVDFTASRGGKVTGYSYGANVGNKQILGAETSYGDAWATDDKIGVAVDRVNDTIQFYKNNSGQGTFAISATADLFPWIGSGGGTSAASGTFNFGADGTFAGLVTAQGNADENGYGNFFYAPPSGFVALCAGNIPTADAVDPAQTDDDYPQKLFSPLIWTGNDATSRAITGLGFQPDWLWFKNRSSAYSNRLYDTTRGISGTGGKRLFTNTAVAENDQTSGQDISAVGTDGFTMGASSAYYNNDSDSGGLQAGWFWRANGGTTAANSLGDIATVTQVDPSGCFSIVTYTGDGVAGQTLGHGLSAAPDMIIVKNRAQGDSWAVYNVSMGNAAHLLLDTSDPSTTGSAYWGSTTPTSTVWTTGNDGKLNANTETYVAYCFANCEGYIKAGGYYGNGDVDGPFVYTGFKPALVIVKFTGSGENWVMMGTKMNPYNVADNMLRPSTSGAESVGSTYQIDILSNGFKPRTTWEGWNGSAAGNSGYAYLAFAYNPFQYATAR